MTPSSPRPGLVEFDPDALAVEALRLAETVLAVEGAVDGVGIAVQRASTVVWDARTGRSLGPGIGWQDLRTVGRCLELRADGVPVAPNQTATKAEWLLAHVRSSHERVDLADVRLGTIDTWLTWHLTGGELHVTDPTNAAVTGLYDVADGAWNHDLGERLGIPATALATVVDTAGVVGTARAITGAPPVAALVGDQQASMVGQGCIEPGMAKITFGTGGMLDVCLGDSPAVAPGHGTFPIVAWRDAERTVHGLEAVMLSAGTSVEWMCDGLGLIETPEQSADVAAEVDDSGGVVFVPALSGIGTPEWDHGARGLLVGVTRGTTRAHVVRAVLEGVAQRGADLVDATEAATGTPIGVLRIDGGMSRNPVFCQALADATGHEVGVAAEREATALGAGLLAGVAVGRWSDLGSATASATSGTATGTVTSVQPSANDRRLDDRARFSVARHRAGTWIPALSALDL